MEQIKWGSKNFGGRNREAGAMLKRVYTLSDGAGGIFAVNQISSCDPKGASDSELKDFASRSLFVVFARVEVKVASVKNDNGVNILVPFDKSPGS